MPQRPVPRGQNVRGPALLRGKPLVALYAIAGALLFVIFLVASFPYGDTISALLAPFQLKLVYQAQRMSPPIGAELQNVRLISTANEPGKLLLQSPTLTLAPTIGSLFRGRPGLRIRVKLFDGIIRGALYQGAGVLDLNFSLKAVNLAKSDPSWTAGALMSGSVSAGGTAELHGPELPLNSAEMTLSGENIGLQVTQGFPLIHFGAVTGVATLDHGTLTISAAEAHGGDAEIKVQGTIQFADDLPDSTIQMQVSLTPTASGREHFGPLLGLLPHPPEQGPYSVRGPLSSPSIS